MNTLTRVRGLHAPTDEAGRLRCDGCDFEANYEGEPPTIPISREVLERQA